MNTKSSLGLLAALVILGGAAGVTWMYRRQIEMRVMSFSADEKAPQAVDPSDGVIRIEVGKSGFTPETVTVAADETKTLEFTRTVEGTCITAVVFPSSGERFDLPMGQSVRVPITIKAGMSEAFTCPMDMYHGKVVASDSESAAAAHDHDPNEIAYWTCSMHPSVKLSTPGTCPICSMDLVSVTRREVETGVILVDTQRRQLIGVTTDTVARRELNGEFRMVGRVVVDETRIAEVTLRYDAWIGEVFADFTGKGVRKGEPMFTFYNPQLWSLQEEFLEATRRGTEKSAAGTALAYSAETRLRLWGIDSTQIEEVRTRGKASEYLRINAPISGTVIEKHVVPGSAVEAGMALYRIADLTTVWVEAEVAERDIQRLVVGQRARITLDGVPEADFTGAVTYIYPGLNPETRTGRVRFAVPNTEGRLKLDMYADVLADLPFGERLTVPVGAVIHAGASHVVFVDLGEGRLEPRHVKVGVGAEGFIEVLEGLREGEVVVTSANFLIAAESKLKSGIEKW